MGFLFQATVIIAILAIAFLVAVAVAISAICGAIAGIFNHYKRNDVSH